MTGTVTRFKLSPSPREVGSKLWKKENQVSNFLSLFLPFSPLHIYLSPPSPLLPSLNIYQGSKAMFNRRLRKLLHRKSKPLHSHSKEVNESPQSPKSLLDEAVTSHDGEYLLRSSRRLERLQGLNVIVPSYIPVRIQTSHSRFEDSLELHITRSLYFRPLLAILGVRRPLSSNKTKRRRNAFKHQLQS